METTGAKVLIVDDDAASRRLLEVRLRSLECSTAQVSDGEAALNSISRKPPDLMLLDLNMPRMGGMELLNKLKQSGADFPVIVITAHGSVDLAVEAIKAGAYDFLPKPFDPNHLEIVVRKALERQGLKNDIEVLTEETGKRHDMTVGQSAAMADAVATARKAAASKATVLLLGESGTGKEVMARAIHQWGERKSRPFVAINCVGLSKELLESELFGHERGAFTGAQQLKKGKMELAHRGTVFLDEIGDISTELQTKLLRFLQEREFERVGGNEPIRVDVRIVGATNRDLEGAVGTGQFREDLYHRLNVIPINLPPLRERRDDIPVLARSFMRRYAAESKKRFIEIADDALAKLTAYHWPGNVRELANVIERAVVLGNGPEVSTQDLPNRVTGTAPRINPKKLNYRDAVEAAKREVVMQALDESGGNRTAAAKALGLHEKYFLRLLKALAIR